MEPWIVKLAPSRCDSRRTFDVRKQATVRIHARACAVVGLVHLEQGEYQREQSTATTSDRRQIAVSKELAALLHSVLYDEAFQHFTRDAKGFVFTTETGFIVADAQDTRSFLKPSNDRISTDLQNLRNLCGG